MMRTPHKAKERKEKVDEGHTHLSMHLIRRIKIPNRASIYKLSRVVERHSKQPGLRQPEMVAITTGPRNRLQIQSSPRADHLYLYTKMYRAGTYRGRRGIALEA